MVQKCMSNLQIVSRPVPAGSLCFSVLLGIGSMLLPFAGHAQDAALPAAGVPPGAKDAPAKAPPVKRPAAAAAPVATRRRPAQRGRASYYHPSLAGRKMANGKKLDLNSHSAASKTLPLGSTAVVTNTDNGRSVTVTIDDRGPYVDGRIVDLTPKTAEELGFKEQGTAPVIVQLVDIPYLPPPPPPPLPSGG